MNDILCAVLSVGGIGLIAGIGLALASYFMSVPVDEKQEKIKQALPGANCGACGFTGCDGYAAAVANGGADTNLCVPGGAAVADAVSAVMGVEAGEVKDNVAVVMCQGKADKTESRFEYHGLKSCAAANMSFGGPGKCNYGCIGFGDCSLACEFGAISVVDGVACVDRNICKGCGKCAAACPKGIISVIPRSGKVVPLCSNHDKGAITAKACSVGCIGCGKCARTCQHGAIAMDKFVARVDHDKCISCGECIEVCPKGIIETLI